MLRTHTPHLWAILFRLMLLYLDMSGSYDRKDQLYRRAKSEGYRSRAAFKLKELNSRFHFIKPGARVFDLGAWPGGWLQVAAQCAGPHGVVVGIDLVEIENPGASNIKIITGDAREEENINRALQLSSGPFDAVLSDMSAKLTGIKEADEAASVGCAELALWVAGRVLKEDGALVIKVFKNGGIEAFVKSMRPLFNKVTRCELDSSRKTSKEFYLAGIGYKGPV